MAIRTSRSAERSLRPLSTLFVRFVRTVAAVWIGFAVLTWPACEMTDANDIVDLILTPSAVVLEPGESVQLEYSDFDDGGEGREVWTSDDEAVATVDEDDGLVTAGQTEGTTTVVLEIIDGSVVLARGIATITVTLSGQTGRIDPQDPEVMVGGTRQLQVVNYSGETPSQIQWESADEQTATVSGTGIVAGIEEGTTTVTVEYLDPMNERLLFAATTVTVVPATTGGDTFIGMGTYPTCSTPEAINLIDTCDLVGGTDDEFGALSGQCLASIACGDRYRVVDLVSRETQFEQETGAGFGSVFGTIGIENGADAALFTFGNEANVLCPTQEGSFCQFTINARTYDATPADGDPGTGEAVLVGPSRGVEFLAPTSEGLGFGFRKEALAPSLFQGEPVSAWLPGTEGAASANRGGIGPLLVLARGQSSFLYEVEGETPNANPLNFGLDARRVRCEQRSNGSYACAVSVFGDDRVGFTEWTVTNAPTSPSFADVGDGPVGLGIHLTSGGRLFVVVTGFNDNTVTEIEYFGQSSAPNVATRAAASECQNPGHAAYAEDSEGLKVIYTCFGSDNYVVEASRFN